MRMNTIGLIVRDVSDALDVLLEIVHSSTHHDTQTKIKLFRDLGSARVGLDLQGMRIGIPWHLSDLASLHEAKLGPLKRIIDALSRAGATVIHDVQISGALEFEPLPLSEKSVLLDTDMKVAVDTYLSSLTTNPQRVHNLNDLIAFTKSCSGENYPLRNVEGFQRAAATSPLDETYLRLSARDEYFATDGGIEGALGRHRCNVLLVPTLCVTLRTFAAKAGSPVMSVPMGSYPPGTIVERGEHNDLVNVAPGIPYVIKKL